MWVRKPSYKSKISTTVIALILFVDAPIATAQSEGERAIELEHQRLEQIQRQRELENRTHTTLPIPEVEPGPALPATDMCFDVNAVEVDGVEQFSVSDIRRLYEPYLNTCMNLTEVNALVGKITRLYLDAGFITSRAYLPQQNLVSGTLKIVVIEGFVEALDISGGDERLLLTAFPGLTGKALNLREIEQGLDQLNQASANARVEFIPGEKIGGTRVKINYEKLARFNFSIGADNGGQESTGEKKTNMSLGWQNPAGFNDSLYLNIQPKTPFSNSNNSSESVAINYAVPYGKWKLSTSISQFEYFTLVFGSNTEFESHGSSDVINFVANRLLARNQQSKFFGELALKKQNSENYIDDILLQTSSREYQSATLAFSWEKFLKRGGMLISSASISRGLSADYLVEQEGENLPEKTFSKINVGVTWYGNVRLKGKQLSAQSGLHGQYSNDELYSSEKLSIGSRYTVRGFNETGLSDASGAYWRNDISWQIPFSEGSVNYWQPYAGLDYGRVSDGTLAGYTVGLKMKGSNLFADLGYSRSISRPDTLADEDALTVVALTLSWRW